MIFNNILADFIEICHIIVSFLVVFGWITTNPLYLIFNIVFNANILIHWITNNGQCILTVIEALIRNKQIDQGFLYRFINPIYNISKFEMKTLLYSILILSMLLSVNKLRKLYIKNKYKIKLFLYRIINGKRKKN